MKKTLSRIQRGLNKILLGYQYNLIKGIRKVVLETKNVYKTVEEVISDALHEIDNRLNRSGYNSFLDQEEDEEPSEDNLLVEYCFGGIMGPNYGVRTLLEYEEECDENDTCENDIDSSEDESDTENFNFSSRGNRHR